MRTAITAAAICAFFAISLSAGSMGDGAVTAAATEPSPEVDNTTFVTVSLQPLLSESIPTLDVFAYADPSPTQAASAPNWLNDVPSLRPAAESVPVHTVQWKVQKSEAAREQSAGAPMLQMILIGVTGVLGLALIGLAVGFFTLRHSQ